MKGQEYLNRWTGLASRGQPGDCTPWLNHLVLLVPEARPREHLLDWMAYQLQYPGTKINHAVVMSGQPGTGKDTLFWPMMQAYGIHGLDVNGDALQRDFNDYLSRAKFIIFQELDLGEHREANRIANKLKPMVATPPDTLLINRKGVPEFAIKNVVQLVLLTNEVEPIKISDKDRRYFVLNILLQVIGGDGNQKLEWVEYFRQLWAWMESARGWEQVAHYLLARDVSGFNPKAAPPMTDAKRDVIEAGRSPLEGMLDEMFDERLGPMARDVTTIYRVQEWMMSQEGGAMLSRYGLDKVPGAVVLGRVMTGKWHQKRVGHGNRRLYLLRNTEESLQLTASELLALSSTEGSPQ
jgi:hypothetical protein